MDPTVVYDAPGEVVVTHDRAASEIVVVWTQFAPGPTFKESLDVQADIVERGEARFIVVDTSTTRGTPSREDQEYLITSVFPRYKAVGLKAIVTVVPNNALTRMGANRWKASGSDFGFAMYDAASVEDAHSLLASEFPDDRTA